MNGTPSAFSRSLAVEGAQEFVDLALAAVGFLVERDADLAVRRGQRLGGEAGVFALDVEVADLAEVEELLVVVGPVGHAAAVDVVGQVVDQFEAGAEGVAIDARQVFEVDIVDRQGAVAVSLVAVDQVDDRVADAADAGKMQLHRAGRDLHRLGRAGEQFGISRARVMDAETHAAGRGAMLAAEEPRGAAGLVVGDEVDRALPPQLDLLGAVAGDQGEAHGGEDRLEHALFRGGELDELEAVEADGVVEQVGHARAPVRGISPGSVSPAGSGAWVRQVS
jgi:hypothetical protein